MNQTSSPTLDELLSVATQSALKAGNLIRKKQREPRQITEKGFRDLVTDADFASQAIIVETIRSHFPAHGFLVEEEAAYLPATDSTAVNDIVWIVDPVDGTTNYSRQQPNFCVSIAAARRPSPANPNAEAEILAAVIYDPMHDELYQATLGQGSALNGTEMRVSDTADLIRAIFAVDWSHDPDQRWTTIGIIEKVAPQVHTIRAIGSAALALAWVAAGRLDGYLNLNLKPWDVAAGKLLITEAGGKLVTVDNDPWRFQTTGFIAGNGRVSPELIVKLTIAQ